MMNIISKIKLKAGKNLGLMTNYHKGAKVRTKMNVCQYFRILFICFEILLEMYQL